MNSLTAWGISAIEQLTQNTAPLYRTTKLSLQFSVHLTDDSLWIKSISPNGVITAFRAAWSPSGELKAEKITQLPNGIQINMHTSTGAIETCIQIDLSENFPVLRYTTSLKPKNDLFVPFWPRDIIITNERGEDIGGEIYAQQVGTRSGQLYFGIKKAKSPAVFYLQNLGALADYNEQTQTSAGETVGGIWPELGFALPPASEKPLKAGKKVIISDAIVVFNEQIPASESERIQGFINLMAATYLQLPKPDTTYQPWPDILAKGLRDMTESPGCWSQLDSSRYFNAYISDYETPPEIMVQLAVLLPLQDYTEWSKTDFDVIKVIREGLSAFYDEKLKTIVRWHPKAIDKLKGDEEQKKPGVMDSWYLHHPLLNLSRMALKGDKLAEKLFLNSIGYAIKVAHHFHYKWPVFYKMDTLDVVKAETAEGKGGEKDVAGLYTHVMIQAYELTGEKKYLEEAEKAAQSLNGYGFELMYQANNTSFSAGALLRLFKITGKKLYLELSYTCIAALLNNVQLWDCNYGYGKNFPKFFSLYPLKDAPYTAVYEEQEVFCALHDYLKQAHDVDILSSVKLLVAEYIRYLVDRAAYYYPPMLPKEMLEENPKVGEIDHNLWIALEDLQDGWLKSGTVGQEVYGAGNAFGIMPRHFLRVSGEKFMVFVDYPTAHYNTKKGSNIHFNVLGDERICCRLMIVKTDRAKLPEFTITLNSGKEAIKGKKVKSGHLEYSIPGNSHVHISWKKA